MPTLYFYGGVWQGMCPDRGRIWAPRTRRAHDRRTAPDYWDLYGMDIPMRWQLSRTLPGMDGFEIAPQGDGVLRVPLRDDRDNPVELRLGTVVEIKKTLLRAGRSGGERAAVETTLSSIGNPGDSVLTLTSTWGFEIGDQFVLTDNTQVFEGIVDAVDHGTKQLTIRERDPGDSTSDQLPTGQDFAVGSAVKVARVTEPLGNVAPQGPLWVARPRLAPRWIQPEA